MLISTAETCKECNQKKIKDEAASLGDSKPGSLSERSHSSKNVPGKPSRSPKVQEKILKEPKYLKV